MAKRILVPLERTLESEAVVLLARDAGASVKLLHVAAVPEPVVDDDGRVLSYADQEMAWVEVDAMDYLRTVELQLEGIPSSARCGSAIRCLRSYVRRTCSRPILSPWRPAGAAASATCFAAACRSSCSAERPGR
jgi:hypothetical protein